MGRLFSIVPGSWKEMCEVAVFGINREEVEKKMERVIVYHKKRKWHYLEALLPEITLTAEGNYLAFLKFVKKK